MTGPPMMYSPCFDSSVLGLGPWWSSALTSDLGLRCAVIAGVGALVLAAALRAGWTLWGPGQSWRQRLQNFRGTQGQSGTATMEFVWVFVPCLSVCMILFQTVLAFSGNLFVHYAAFVATRSAIVEAPNGQLGGGGSLSDDGNPAYDRAERAAAFALAPVSGRLNASGGDPGAFEAGLASYFREYGQDSPAWVGNLAAERLAYAQAHTTLDLYVTRVRDNGDVELDKLDGPPGSNTVDFGPKDPVTVGVSHKLHLSIPYASAFFADGTHQTVGGETAYSIVTATSTMTLEGYDVNLPELPEVEREQ